jgi:glycosyltransferase involved in cell wall biosynthesis
MAHGLSFILDSIQEFQVTHPNFHFLFIGDGAERQNLIQQAQSLGLINTSFVESVSKNEVVRYLSLMDIALVNLRKSDTFLTVIPSKIFEAAAMHKPILLGLEGETKEIIEDYDAGLCFEPENKIDFLAKAIELSDPVIYQQKLKGCISLSKDFDRSIIAEKLLLEIKGVIR